ncbi:hypothetical protein [Melittangium boletus]|uniref:hypothetical protein n=1 Tax=Melittangium boletus TaxID=83453 RepID=UPI003DA22DDC
MGALLAGLLSANPYADPFWARDLNALVVQLAEPLADAEQGEQRRLYVDLVHFLNCEPLAPAPATEELFGPRTLLRLEQARRGRLGAAASSAPTLWRDVLAPDFFRRAAPLPQDQALRWPLEDERWNHERLEFRLKPSSCGQPVPAADELSLLSPQLRTDLRETLEDEAWARLSHHQASRLLVLGQADAAREVARAFDPAALAPEERPLDDLLRLALGLLPPSHFERLAREPALAAYRLPLVVQAAARLAQEGRWEDVLALTASEAAWPGADTPPAEVAPRREIFYRRALAHQALGHREALAQGWVAVFPALAGAQDPLAEALRGLALASLTRGGLGPESLVLLRDLGPAAGLGRRLATLGGLALEQGNTRLALDVSERLLKEPGTPGRARGHTLRAEVALAAGDAAGFTRAIERLLTLRRQDRAATKDLDEVDRIVLALAQSVVTTSADLSEARWRPVLATQLEAMRQGVHSRHDKVFPPLFAALEDRAPQAAAKGKRARAFVAVGQVAVGAPPGMLPPPDFSVAWPEPYSLLALPRADGTSRAWFPRGPSSPPPVSAPAKTEVPHAP